MKQYLVCYDITDDKRLRTIHKIMKGYGEPWQYSVFLCRLKHIDRIRMEADIDETINRNNDQVIIISLGENDSQIKKKITVLGKKLPNIKSGIIVI